MRHARIATTLDIYAQHVSDSQRRAVTKGKPRKLDERVMPGFPPEKLIWN